MTPMAAPDPIAALWPGLFQQAFVVRDLAAARAAFEAQLGVPRWLALPEMPVAVTVRGTPVTLTLRLAFGYCGETQIELIEPAGEVIGPYHEFLVARGGGPHHLGFLVDTATRETALAAYAARGVPVLMDGAIGGVTFTYLDTAPLLTEIVVDGDGSMAGMRAALLG